MSEEENGSNLTAQLKKLLNKGLDWESLGIPNTKYEVVKRPANKSYKANLGLKIPFRGYKGLFFSNLEDVMEFAEEFNSALESVCMVMSKVDSINGKTTSKKQNKAKGMLTL